jgi:murein DD-endopeptidase MepM/ murein hydrolase activator NlpD
MLPIAGGVIVFAMLRESTNANSLTSILPTGTISYMSRVLQEAAPARFGEQPTGVVVNFVVRNNDTLERIFRRLSINLNDLALIRNLPGVREKLDTLRPGELISLTHSDGSLLRLGRRLSETTTLSVTRERTYFESRVIENAIESRLITAHGTIETSLFASGRAAGISSDVILRLANEIFGWDIDFALEIQPKDEFSVVYEQKYRDGVYIGDGKIRAAEFVNAGRAYRAVRYDSPDAEITGYFTPDGKSMRKQFLRAPVDFKYISSNFNPRRLHPVLNITRAHQGVDYAAPTGTPVRAAGDGRVVLAGVKGGYGKAIILEHGGSISTLYGHLSRFAKDIRIGARVNQGDVIGFVGSTGTATASHLHYEYRVNGAHKNPRTIALPDANPIPAAHSLAFQQSSSGWLAELDKASPVVSVLAKAESRN